MSLLLYILFPLEPWLLLPFHPPQHPFNCQIKSVLNTLNSLTRLCIHNVGYNLDHFPSHPSYIFLANFLKHPSNGGPILYFIAVYKNRVTDRFLRQEPLVLKIRSSLPEENWDRSGDHAVENRPAGETIASRLQAKIRVKKSFEDCRCAVGATWAAAVQNSAWARVIVALSQQQAPEIRPYKIRHNKTDIKKNCI